MSERKPAAAPPVSRVPISMAAILAELDADDDVVAEVGELAPLSGPAQLQRSTRTVPVADLNGLSKLWLLFGEGNSGKTMFARYLVDRLMVKSKLEQTTIAALAPGNRNLANFVQNINQPPSTDPRETADYVRKAMTAMAKRRLSGVFDFGGGDASMRHLVEALPTLTDTMEEGGLALIAAHVLTPRAADLAFLKTYERLGFRPRATALILNLARAESPAVFDGLRRQPEYKAALDRGAVELFLPALPQEVALRIERAAVHFSQARDGEAPEGRRPASISLLERVVVRGWLEEMGAEFRAVEGWMPWT